MSEFIRSADYLYDPKYWDGHTFGDECDFTEIQLFSESFGDILKKEQAYAIEAALVLKGYDADVDDSPTAEFRTGTTFVLSDYPIGTIIRETSENFAYANDDSEKYQPAGIVRGVIISTKKYKAKQVVLFDKDKNIVGLRLGGIGNGEIEVGSTEHVKTVGSTKRTILAGAELLHKPSLIEIMKIGKGDKSPVRSDGGLFPRFSFGRQGV